MTIKIDDDRDLVVKLPTWLWGIIVTGIIGSFVMIPNLYVSDIIASEIDALDIKSIKRDETIEAQHYKLASQVTNNDKSIAIINTKLNSLIKVSSDAGTTVSENQELLKQLVRNQ